MKELINLGLGIGFATEYLFCFRVTLLGYKTELLEFKAKQRHRLELEVSFKYIPNRFGLVFINNQLFVDDVVANGRIASHPHTEFLRCSNFV